MKKFSAPTRQCEATKFDTPLDAHVSHAPPPFVYGFYYMYVWRRETITYNITTTTTTTAAAESPATNRTQNLTVTNPNPDPEEDCYVGLLGGVRRSWYCVAAALQ